MYRISVWGQNFIMPGVTRTQNTSKSACTWNVGQGTDNKPSVVTPVSLVGRGFSKPAAWLLQCLYIILSQQSFKRGLKGDNRIALQASKKDSSSPWYKFHTSALKSRETESSSTYSSHLNTENHSTSENQLYRSTKMLDTSEIKCWMPTKTTKWQRTTQLTTGPYYCHC